MESLNHDLFLIINAGPDSPDWLVALARFFARDLIAIVPIVITALWLWSSKRKLVINTITALVVAMLFTTIIREIYPVARPFAEGVGHQWLNHAPTSSFPSNHGTVIFTFSVSFLFWDRLRYALGLLLAAGLIGWSRVYLGVHWPLDMLGAATVALVACAVTQFIWRYFGRQILGSVEHVYHLVFSVLIRRGWVKN